MGIVIDINEQRKKRLEEDLEELVQQVNQRYLGNNNLDLKEATKAMIEFDRAIAELERDETVREEAML